MSLIKIPLFEGRPKETSRSSIASAGGHTKYISGSSAVEGHFKEISRSHVIEDQLEQSRLTPAASAGTQSEVSSQGNVSKRKVWKPRCNYQRRSPPETHRKPRGS